MKSDRWQHLAWVRASTYLRTEKGTDMARDLDVQATARILCKQSNVTIEETDGMLRFAGRGIDFKIRSWDDLNLRDLKPLNLHGRYAKKE